MTPLLEQTLVALIFLCAVAYLIWRWGKTRRSGCSGCGTGKSGRDLKRWSLRGRD